MSKSIAQIKEEFGKADEKEREALYSMYDADARSGVQKLIASYRKKEEALRLERERLSLMKSYERKYKDAEMICGIDEAGRGPLAGPVVAGAVILPKNCEILYLNDSKQLTAKKRDELYDVIMREAVAVGIGYASPARIDEINILQATYEAMREAISKLSVKPDVLLNDAVKIPQVDIRQVPIIKGDAKVLTTDAVKHIAVANPKLAPYGLAAHETMDKLGIKAAITPKIVEGDNIGKTFQFVSTGNAEAGFIALSQCYKDGKMTSGSGWIIPQEYYNPIAQDAVLLKKGEKNEAAKKFLEYLRTSEKAAQVRAAYGYDTAK